MDEFSLIKRYFQTPNTQASVANAALVTGIGDDCAVLRVPSDKDLVFSLDTLVESVHFPQNTDAAELAWRLLGAAVSDLAAMGAQPNNFTLALTLPELDQSWLQRFSEQLTLASAYYKITLSGGDTTKGPLTLSVQVQGFVERGQALLRSGANIGDLICVTGTLGDSRAGLSLLDIPGLAVPIAMSEVANADREYLLNRYYRPTARVASGLLIKEYATSCIDVSDGLLADLNHILVQSDVGAKLVASDIPMSAQMQRIANDQALTWALSGGEDFELCFTISPEKWRHLQLKEHPVKMQVIGEIVPQKGIQMLTDGCWQDTQSAGFNHFKSR